MTPAWVLAERARCRRPIVPGEVPHLEALGWSVRHRREAAGLSRSTVAALAEMRCSSLSRIEAGACRTRRSTLERLAAALDVPDPAGLVEEWVGLAGPALAPESQFRERVERRRRRRFDESERVVDLALVIAEEMARRMVREQLAERDREWRSALNLQGHPIGRPGWRS